MLPAPRFDVNFPPIATPRRRRLSALSAALLSAIALLPAAAQAETVWAVGDGAVPEKNDDVLVDRIAREGIDKFLYLGDVYESGTAEEFRTNYDSSFGRFKEITSPTPGNHEWPDRATGYDPYWGSRGLQPDGSHYYSFDYAGWHFVSLNSHEDSGPESPQVAWLKRDLAGYDGTCTVGFWHRPRYSAGGHGYNEDVEPFWQALSGHAVVALSGHDHNYERLTSERGIVQFVVGSGGRELDGVKTSHHRLVAYDQTHFGALRMRLSSGRMQFEFMTSAGRVGDHGAFNCRPHTKLGGGPSVTIRTPASGRTYSRRLSRLSGSAAGTTGAPRLTLVRRLSGGRCAAFNGTRFAGASCSTRRSFAATGSTRWSYRLPVRLARGSYKLAARVTGEGGRTALDAARFRIR